MALTSVRTPGVRPTSPRNRSPSRRDSADERNTETLVLPAPGEDAPGVRQDFEEAAGRRSRRPGRSCGRHAARPPAGSTQRQQQGPKASEQARSDSAQPRGLAQSSRVTTTPLASTSKPKDGGSNPPRSMRKCPGVGMNRTQSRSRAAGSAPGLPLSTSRRQTGSPDWDLAAVKLVDDEGAGGARRS